MTTNDLRTFLQAQPASELAEVLLDLAEDHDEVRERLNRMQLAERPDKLAAAFRKTLQSWKRSHAFHDYKSVPAYAGKLESWLGQVARELAPRNPSAAVDLFEEFIEADRTFFENADDSGGHVGDAVRAACECWLKAAAQCETPESVWRERILQLYDGDEYGAREGLLRGADKLLGESGLRAMVDTLEQRMAQVVVRHQGETHLPYEVIKVSAALSLLSEALGDADVRARAVLSYSPKPNALQSEQIARAYLETHRPADAMKWLSGHWEHLEGRRLFLLAEAHAQLGRPELRNPLRWKLFEDAPSAETLRHWLEALPLAEQAGAHARAREVALKQSDPGKAALLLVELDLADQAEALLVERANELDGGDYFTLPGLAKKLAEGGHARGATAVYRALLLDVLARANAKAYGHAARYLSHLRALAASGTSLVPLQAHDAFEELLRQRHGHKPAFWARVNEL